MKDKYKQEYMTHMMIWQYNVECVLKLMSSQLSLMLVTKKHTKKKLK